MEAYEKRGGIKEMAKKVTAELIERIVKILSPFYTKKELVPNELEYNGYSYSMEDTELFIYSKLRSLFLGKLLQEIFGKEEIVARHYLMDEVQVNNNLLLYQGRTSTEAICEFFYEQEGFPSGEPFFWKDSFALFGSQISEENDLLDFYLTDLDYLQVEHSTVKCSTLEEYSKVGGYASAIESIKGWWKEPYQDEMALALIENVYSVLEDMSCEETQMDYNIQLNVAIVPFLERFHHMPENTFDKKVVRLAKKMIKELETPNMYFPWCLTGMQSGYTKNYFFNITTMGQSYDSTLWADCISLKAEMAFYTLDYLLAYLDMKYDYLPKEMKSYYE